MLFLHIDTFDPSVGHQLNVSFTSPNSAILVNLSPVCTEGVTNLAVLL